MSTEGFLEAQVVPPKPVLLKKYLLAKPGGDTLLRVAGETQSKLPVLPPVCLPTVP